ncbi:hypothetical protein [Spirosoma gilvum]
MKRLQVWGLRISLFVCFFDLTSSVQAQLGGFIKKAQDKLKSGVSISTGSASTAPEKQPQGASSVSADQDYDRWIKDKSFIGRDLLRLSDSPSQYLTLAKTLDYGQTIQTLKKKGKPANYNVLSEYNRLLEFDNQYTQYFESDLKGYLNRELEEAFRQKVNSPTQALKTLERISPYAEAVTLILPNYEAAKALKNDIDKAYNSLNEQHGKSIFTSDFHRQHAGQILFSKSPIVVGKEKADQFATAFTSKDHIYAVAYLKGTIQELAEGNLGASYRYYVDGNMKDRIDFKHNKEDMVKSVYAIEILPEPNQANHAIDAPGWAEALAILSPRSHQLKVEFISPGTFGDPLASGEITLDLSGMNPDELRKNAALAAQHARSTYVNPTEIPDDFKKVSGRFQDPALSAANLTAAIERDWKVKVLKLVVEPDGTDWHIDKNELGLPTKKVTNGHAHVLYKDNLGCHFVRHLGFRRDYAGGGTYGPVVAGNGYGTSEAGDLNCDKIK